MARLWDISQARIKQGRSGRVTRTVEIRLITPLFGGGVEVLQVDSPRPVSEKGIRGQLRFWWRATRGVCCSTVEQLAEHETRVFGSPDNASSLEVKAEVTKKGEAIPVEQWVWREAPKNPGGGKWGTEFTPQTDRSRMRCSHSRQMSRAERTRYATPGRRLG